MCILINDGKACAPDTAEEQDTQIHLRLPPSLLQGRTIISEAERRCQLVSPELVQARANVVRIAQLSVHGSNDVAEAASYSENLRAAVDAVDQATLATALHRQPKVQATVRAVKEICDSLAWAAKRASDEYTRLRVEVLPSLRPQERQCLRQSIFALPSTPYTAAFTELWEQEDRFERKQVRFYRKRAAEARRTTVIAHAAEEIARGDLARVLEVQEQLETLVASLTRRADACYRP